jgi:hypothetical protein
MEVFKREKKTGEKDIFANSTRGHVLADHETRMCKHAQRKIECQGRAFTFVLKRLDGVLQRQQQFTQELFGQLVNARTYLGGLVHHQFEWASVPRLVRLRVDCFRALKNKLPAGRYVVMVTLYDRLGGHPLRTMKLTGKGKTFQYFDFTTTPQRHNGRFNSLELNFHQTSNYLHLVCPSKRDSRPSNVFMVELFAARAGRNNLDAVVAWGAIPLVNNHFEVVKGKFRVPMLRGEINREMDKFKKIENAIRHNVDHWLCNCYVDVRHMPRCVGKHNEYKVQKTFTSSFLGTNITPMEDAGDGDVNVGALADDVEGKTQRKVKSFATLPRRDNTDAATTVALETVRDNRREKKKNKRRRLYKYSVINMDTDVPANQADVKWRYIMSEIWADLQLSRIATIECWTAMIMLVVACYARLFVRYCGEFLFLHSMDVSVYEFKIYPYTIDLRYQSDMISLQMEALVVVVGHLSNIILFCVMFLACMCIEFTFQSFPDMFSRFLLGYGLAIIADPLLVAFDTRREWNWWCNADGGYSPNWCSYLALHFLHLCA